MITPDDVRSLVAVMPQVTEGAKVVGVKIDLERVPTEQFAQLIRDSWRHRAPAEIAHELDPDD